MFHDHAVKFWGTEVSRQEDSAPSSQEDLCQPPHIHSELPEHLLGGRHPGSAEGGSLSTDEEADIISPCFRDSVLGTMSLQCVAKGML